MFVLGVPVDIDDIETDSDPLRHGVMFGGAFGTRLADDALRHGALFAKKLRLRGDKVKTKPGERSERT